MTPGRQASPLWDAALLAVVGVLLAAASLSIAVTQIGLGLGLALLLGRWLVAGVRPPRLGLELPALALVLWAALMIPFSTAPEQSLLFFRRFYLLAALWVAAAAAARDETRRAALLGCLLLGAVAVSVWGAAEMVARTGGLFGQRLGRMSNPMTSGAVLMAAALAAGAVALQGGLPRRWRLAAAAAALPVLVALAQTMTRSAWLGLAVGALAMVLAARPRLALPVLGAAVVAAALLLLAPRSLLPARMAAITAPANVTGGASTSRRLAMWRGGWEMVKDRPLTGVGDRDMHAIGPRYYEDDPDYYHGHLHSNPVMFAAIWGVPGFLIAMAFVVAMPVRLLQARRALAATDRAPPWATAWNTAALGVWAGLFVAGLFEWYFGDAETQTLQLAIVGAALGAARGGDHD